jgi:hypothetical protein
MTFRVFLD